MLAIAGVLTGLLFVGSASALGFLWYADGLIVDDPCPGCSDEPREPMKPVNFLILGSDTREGLSEEEQARKGSPEQVGGERSDTLILAHFDPRRDQAVLIHFPRDLRVEIPGHGTDKINAAFTLGGPDLTVRTVKAFSGIPIHHYVKVDFNGFRSIVEALGGVEICVDRPMFDELAELDLPRAGCYTMDGDTALAFVRARNVEGDVIPDFARIARQQQFIRAVMNEVFSVGSLPKLPSLITRAARNVSTDDEIDITGLIELGNELKGLAQVDPSGASTIDLRAVPGRTQTIGGISYVIAEPDAQQLFDRLRDGRPLGDFGTEQALTPVSPANIQVRVLDAGGQVEAAEQLLRDAGFVVLEGGAAPPARSVTAILHANDAAERAEVVAGYFEGVPVRRGFGRALGGAQVAVVIGPDWTGPPS